MSQKIPTEIVVLRKDEHVSPLKQRKRGIFEEGVGKPLIQCAEQAGRITMDG